MIELITGAARELGFSAAGFCLPQRPPFFDSFIHWIKTGYHGRMKWLERNIDIREDPTKLLPGCKTIVCLSYPYSPDKPVTPDGFTLARYSEPTLPDYHKRLRNLAKTLGNLIEKLFPGSSFRVCVDSAPILERSLAVAAGIGFMGKNTNLIVPGAGSYHFLLEILTTADIHFTPAIPLRSRCDCCTLCTDACPTGALERPFILNASRCLSYITIEDRKPVDETAASRMGRCFLGCDICQEICPFNKGATLADPILPSSCDILAMTDEIFISKFGKTALKRAGLAKIKDNLKAVLSQSSPLI